MKTAILTLLCAASLMTECYGLLATTSKSSASTIAPSRTSSRPPIPTPYTTSSLKHSSTSRKISTPSKTSSTASKKPSTSSKPSSTSSKPSSRPSSFCSKPDLRVEWRTLKQSQKDNYIAAVHCLNSKPSRLGLNTTLYNDFPYVHTKLNNVVHFVAQFLPWHRYFVHLYEKSLMECGFAGPIPYWDWTLDSAAPQNSSIWSATSGFGGNGLNGQWVSPVRPNPLTMCVQDGPFKNLTVAYSTADYDPHCLNRGFNNNGPGPLENMGGDFFSPKVLNNITKSSATYEAFHTSLENGPHGAVHQSVGGDMFPASSPNDPIFFLHHTQIDRLWWIWQQNNPSVRNTDYGGNRYQVGASKTANATMSDKMPMAGLAKQLTVAMMMTTESDLLCYRY